MSASLLDTPWNFPIGCPNCSRERAYATHASSCRRIAPTTLAKMQLRSHSMDELKMAMPAPSGPSRLSTGTRQSSSAISPIGEVRRPIFSKPLLTISPGVALSTRNADRPARPGRSVTEA